MVAQDPWVLRASRRRALSSIAMPSDATVTAPVGLHDISSGREN